MTYKNKLVFLVSLISALAVIYTASVVFNPQSAGSRSSLYSWLDSKLASKISRIEIINSGESYELSKKNNQWFVSHNENEYQVDDISSPSEFPARNLRVEDFIGIFTERALWQTRSSSASSHERLGVDAQNAGRVVFYAENSVLLDLLFGSMDVTGNEVYVREYSRNEVRSGNSAAVSYITGTVNSWYNLRLLAETEDGKIGVDSVQRLSVYWGDQAQIFTRKNRQWSVSGVYVANPDQSGIDAYVRTVLNMEGDNFSEEISAAALESSKDRIVLEFGNGVVKTIFFSEPDEQGRRFANVSGSEYVYSIASWAAQRLFKSAADFEKQ